MYAATTKDEGNAADGVFQQPAKTVFHGLIRANRNAQFAGNALNPLKDTSILVSGHPMPSSADTDAGCTVCAAVLMPFDILSKD